jgi:hypothetical protein
MAVFELPQVSASQTLRKRLEFQTGLGMMADQKQMRWMELQL